MNRSHWTHDQEAPASPDGAWQYVTLAASCASVICAHAATLGYRKFANVDEAYAGALAERLLEGRKLYAGAISQRGPLMYYIFELIAKVAGWDNILVIRALALAYQIGFLAALYWAGSRLVSRRVATLTVALASYALAFGFEPLDAIALNGETLLLPLLVMGTTWGVLALRNPAGTAQRRKYLVFAGLALGIAASIKQVAIVHPLPVVLGIAMSYAGSRMARVCDVLVFVLAALLVPSVLAMQAARDGTLSSLLYYCFTYNAQVHIRPTNQFLTGLGYTLGHLAAKPSFVTALALVFAFAGPLYVRRLRAGLRARSIRAALRNLGVFDYLLVNLALALATAIRPPQAFDHSYLPVLPFLLPAVAWIADRYFVRGLSASTSRRVATGVSCAWALASLENVYQREKSDGRVAHEAVTEVAAHYVESITSKSDKLFVWGFSPWLYGYAHRRPAGRYVFMTYPTGFVPWFWDALSLEEKRRVPGSVEGLLSDLQSEKPEVVIDAGNVQIARPLRAYAPFAAWLHADYCFDARIGAFDVYRRKVASGCTVKGFPCEAAPVDFFDRPLYVPVPVSVDRATCEPLPPGPYLEPRRFGDHYKDD